MGKKINQSGKPERKFRFRFSKLDEFKYFSHLDIISIVVKAFRRAKIRVKYSEGFNPKPKISFGPPTPLGAESRAEYGDVVILGNLNEEDFVSRLNGELKNMTEITGARKVPVNLKSLMSQVDVIRYSIYFNTKETPDAFGEGLLNTVKESHEFSGSIYKVEDIRNENGRKVKVLNLFGYAKIFKDRNLQVFKLGDFLAYLEEILQEYRVKIEKVVKEELYIIEDQMLLTPFEVI